jgi:splicing factor 3B subunit 3
MTYIVIGTAKGLSAPASSSGSGYALETYCFRGGKLNHLHSTEIEDVPLCMIEFQDKLLVGIGRSLRLYDLGRKRLLRKCELRGFPNHITKLAVSGGRVFVGDVTDSVTFVKYDKLDNTLKVFAEEQRPRLVLSSVSVLPVLVPHSVSSSSSLSISPLPPSTFRMQIH